LDSDDEWHHEKLQKQVEFHNKNQDIKISYTDEKWIRDAQEIKVPKKFQKCGGFIFEKCLSHCIIAPSAVMMHKDVVKNLGLFDESLEVCEDYDLWLRISEKEEIGLVDEKLIVKYAGHDDQLSFKHWGMDRFRVVALEKLISSGLSRGSSQTRITQELIKKYTLLHKGAIKYDRIHDAKKYEKRLKELNDELN
jgi:hypothetical protein